jgi:hypothetical protein
MARSGKEGRTLGLVLEEVVDLGDGSVVGANLETPE